MGKSGMGPKRWDHPRNISINQHLRILRTLPNGLAILSVSMSAPIRTHSGLMTAEPDLRPHDQLGGKNQLRGLPTWQCSERQSTLPTKALKKNINRGI